MQFPKHFSRYSQITVLLLSATLAYTKASAQDQDTTYYGMRIMMDEVVIKAVKKGWDLQAFVRRMQTDTTFYKAFLGLKVVNYESENNIRILDANNKPLATMHNNTIQKVAGSCRTVSVVNERTSGDFYKKDRQPAYFTAELFQRLFFRPGKECGVTDRIADAHTGKGNKLDKAKEQLKQLVFNPGSKVSGVPFAGDKASIFDADMMSKYDFSLKFDTYEGVECYVFRAVPKKEYAGDVIFNQLDTWFRTADYSIMARDYSLSYHTMVYDFDVRMKVRLEQKEGRLLPASIDYQGNWHVMMKKRERAVLNIVFDY